MWTFWLTFASIYLQWMGFPTEPKRKKQIPWRAPESWYLKDSWTTKNPELPFLSMNHKENPSKSKSTIFGMRFFRKDGILLVRVYKQPFRIRVTWFSVLGDVVSLPSAAFSRWVWWTCGFAGWGGSNKPGVFTNFFYVPSMKLTAGLWK